MRRINKKVVNKRFASGKGDYENVIAQIEEKGKCPFCPNNFKYHRKPVLRKSGSWLITENSWPYPNAKHHFLLINARHVESFLKLGLEDFEAIRKLIRWAIKKHRIKGGALAMRFGDTDHTGATVSHIHAHLICPKIGRGKKSKTVNFPVG